MTPFSIRSQLDHELVTARARACCLAAELADCSGADSALLETVGAVFGRFQRFFLWRRGPSVRIVTDRISRRETNNVNGMLLVNNTFGANWLVPSEILNARLFKFGLQVTF